MPPKVKVVVLPFLMRVQQTAATVVKDYYYYYNFYNYNYYCCITAAINKLSCQFIVTDCVCVCVLINEEERTVKECFTSKNNSSNAVGGKSSNQLLIIASSKCRKTRKNGKTAREWKSKAAKVPAMMSKLFSISALVGGNYCCTRRQHP